MANEALHTLGITYVKNKSIDRLKWNKCIDDAPNGLIYAMSFYLDAMALHWDALVLNDYEAVMPLTWNRKYGIYYLYQPFLCASLGLFGNHITANMLSCFLNHIPKRFKYWDVYLNAGNNFSLKEYNLYRRTNYILSTDKPYATLFRDFRESYKQLIKKSGEKKLEVKQNIKVEEIISLAKARFETFGKRKKADWKNFIRLYEILSAKSEAINYGIYMEGKLLASGIFLFSKNRAFYVLAGNKSEGRSSGASHLVINEFIQQHANKNIILDFEGSNIPGIAFFFKGFGARAEEYPGLRYNGLPPLLRKLKR